MTAATPLRRTVKPAHAGARIPDPAHRNFLPPGGTAVVWDPYWAGRLKRGEIEIVEPGAVADAPPDAPGA